MNRGVLFGTAAAVIYAAALAATWRLGVADAEKKTEATLDVAVKDFRDTIAGAIDTTMSHVGGCVVVRLGGAVGRSIEEMASIADDFDVDELNVVARNGDILASNDRDVMGKEGASMLDHENSAQFMVLTNGTTQAFSQPFRAGAHNPDAKRKYLGVAFPGGNGYVQVGLDERRLARGLCRTMLGFIFNKWALGETGYFLCSEIDTDDLVLAPAELAKCAKKLSETGYSAPEFSSDLPTERQTFEATVFGEDCFCREYVFAGHRLVAVLPAREFDSIRYRQVAVVAIVLGAVMLVVTLLLLRIDRDSRRLKAFYAAEEAARARDYAIAGTIQSAALPTEFPDSRYFSLSAAMTPAKEVGGDFYDFFTLDDTHVAFLVADVSGKGTPAALYMMTAKTLIRDTLLARRDVASALTAVNGELCRNNPANMFVTAWVGVLDLETGGVSYVNAGHNPPVLRRQDGSLETLKERSGPILAFMEGVKYRPRTVLLSPGETLFLYTDGVTEAMDGTGALFGEERLLAALSAPIPGNAPKSVCNVVRAAVAAFAAGASAADDLTVLAIQYRERARRGVRTFKPTMEAVSDASAYLDSALEACGCSVKARRELAIVLDEVVSNIVKYSGASGFSVDVKPLPGAGLVRVVFTDDGKAYNPLEKADPDTTLSAEARPIGGLGILMVKHLTDAVGYARVYDRNVLTVDKRLGDLV